MQKNEIWRIFFICFILSWRGKKDLQSLKLKQILFISIHCADSLCEQLLKALLNGTNASGAEQAFQPVDAGKKS